MLRQGPARRLAPLEGRHDDLLARGLGRSQVNSWLGSNPYRRAVTDTCRGPLSLSTTIRRFFSADQRRRAPLWITLSRDTLDLGV
jgi:hypothetical protein